jgi:cbb3-type cytochrome oxidase cytochrome c subunit/mono/diheme cytochrome c family protein
MKRFVRMSYLVASVGGVGFFAMSVLLLGVWPGRVLEEQIRSTSPPHPLALTASEKRGRAIYGQDGCAYCHTQQIRYLDRDVRRFGNATLAWETIFDYPQLWGTRRIGPDLSREGAIRAADWQFEHLYSPRAVVADSVMPAFPFLFNGAPERPKQTARDLVAYLETLGRDRELAGPEGEAHARATCECSDEERRLAFDSGPLNGSPVLDRRHGNYPILAASHDTKRGLELYAHNCASCHGAHGEGDGKGAQGLHPHPQDLAQHEYTLDALSDALWDGAAGTAMPAWRDLPPSDLAAIAAVVMGFHKAGGASAPANSPVGQQVYNDHCAQCHGENGDGNGPASDRFPISASNFQNERPSLDVALQALHNGVEGTSMAPWTSQLSEAEINAVASYVRGFFNGGARP